MRYYYTSDPFNGLFDDLFGSWSDSGRRFPPVDLYETDRAYVIEMEVAGYGEDEVRLHVDRHVLEISSEGVKEAEDRSYLTHEIHTPAFRRSFSLPENVDEGAIEASYDNGMLVVTIPKKAEAQARRIEVKIASPADREGLPTHGHPDGSMDAGCRRGAWERGSRRHLRVFRA